MSKTRRVSGYTLAWAFWIVFFLVVEGMALRRRAKGDTFSEHWWAAFRVRDKVPATLRVVLTVVQVAFGVWLTGHLAFGWWTL